MQDDFTCGFIGLGLIGGSIARAMRLHHPACRMMAYDINKDALELAAREGVIDLPLSSISKEFGDCDYIFLCAPVSENDNNLVQLKKYISPRCLLTDAGSVKGDIHRHIEEAGLGGQFIGGHPMAGSERTGYINSKALLLENAYYILTPCEGIPGNTIAAFRELVASLGALPLVLDYSRHDYITAAISHLPHVIASSLVNLIKNSDEEDGLMKLIAAGGFKDITRIASSSPVMWQQICLTNGSNISQLLDDYIQSLNQIRKAFIWPGRKNSTSSLTMPETTGIPLLMPPAALSKNLSPYGSTLPTNRGLLPRLPLYWHCTRSVSKISASSITGSRRTVYWP